MIRDDVIMEPKASKLSVFVGVFLVILAIVIGLYLQIQVKHATIDKEALHAIKRAKSLACKDELNVFASTGRHKIDVIARLPRQCKLDSSQLRFEKSGCIGSITNDTIRIEDHVEDTNSCLDLCFSYGHRYGGFDIASSQCYCGDNNFGEESCGDLQLDWHKLDSGIYMPSDFNISSRSAPVKVIKIAFVLVLKGKNVRQISRLIENIYSPSHLYYIHVDGRDQYLFDSLYELYEEKSNFIFATNRLNTIWGGTSLLRMYLNAIKDLQTLQWDFIINLSESDYPVKSLDKLESYLRERTDLIFLKHHNMKGYNYIQKQGLNRHFYQCDDHLWHMGFRSLPVGIVYSGGSDWFALPRDFCLYIAQQETNSSGLVKPLINVFNHTLLPAESFFHTLALNSEFCDKYADNNLRYTNWDRKRGCKCQHRDVVDWCGCSPLVYRKTDWNRLRATKNSPNVFFSRKFDPTISSSIIGLVDKFLLDKASGDDWTDTRLWTSLWNQTRKASLPNNLGTMLQQLAAYALIQMNYPQQGLTIANVDQYFNQDRFVGLVFKCCRGSSQNECILFLLERKLGSHLSNLNKRCFARNEAELKVIEVNHGFDIGERMFRRYDPLNIHSNVVVYHQWLLKNRSVVDDDLMFTWINPNGRVVLKQKVELRTSQQSKLSLVHKLTVRKPIEPGLWKLVITLGPQQCVEYRFLIFDESPNKIKAITQENFDDFFDVSQKCFSLETCQDQDWNLYSLDSTVK